MPELPEVEHVVRALRTAVSNRRIVAAELRLKRTAPGMSFRRFAIKLRNAMIERVERRGKYILIGLDGGRVLLVHLRMTGKFLLLRPEDPLPRYAHAIFYLDDERRLIFCDMRQFGRMILAEQKTLQRTRELASLAPEPLTGDFTYEYLRTVLSQSRRSVKQLLLDQTKIVGLGNIYAVEALFLARINPLKAANSISKRRVAQLHESIRQVLNEAIESGSTLKIDLADSEASYFGSDERFWRVYEREGEPCVNCSARIRRIVHGGRSTYYCPRCQRG